MNYIERYQVWCKTAPLCEGDLKELILICQASFLPLL